MLLNEIYFKLKLCKALFYKSQAKIADLEEQFEALTSDLKAFMQNCEEAVVESDDIEENN